MILTNDEDIAKKINSAVFPGLQGGPLMHVIAAKAVAFGEALQPEFKAYAHRSSTTPRRWPTALKANGLDIVSGGTDNHLMLVDLRPKNATGKRAEAALGRADITCNKNGIPVRSRKSRSSPRASGSARRPARRAASAWPSSARSAT